MTSKLMGTCNIDLPPLPAVPSWLGSLCSQIDSYKDSTLPQVFTPRDFVVPERHMSHKTPVAKTEKNWRLKSSQLTANEGQVSDGIDLVGNDSLLEKKHDHLSYKTHEALSQQEIENIPMTQPWPSLQPLPERRGYDSRDSIEDKHAAEFSQPWPSCDVRKPASQACRITKSRLTCSYLTSTLPYQNQNLEIHSSPDLFGKSPTYSPPSLLPASSQNFFHPTEKENVSEHVGWKRPVQRLRPINSTIMSAPSNTRGKRPNPSIKQKPLFSSHTHGHSPALQTSQRPNVCLSTGTVDCTSSNGEIKTANRNITSVENRSDLDVCSRYALSSISATLQMENCCNPFTPAVISFQGAGGTGMKLHSVEEIHFEDEFMLDRRAKPFCDIFPFPFFNAVQSMAFDKLLYSDSSVVVSAPTGSGKTALFELAIIRLLLCAQVPRRDIKVVYIGPMKSLCGERVDDWRQKLSPLGLDCVELTGDSDLSDITNLQYTQVICTTPEKWDSMTRRWKDNRQLFHSICLVCIDEVHVVGDAQRGATMEAVITRMKMVQTLSAGPSAHPIRFVAVSATLPNTEDIGEWLSSHSSQAAVFKLGEEYRPVRLQRVVLGYPFSEGSSEFRFDLNLTYKLHSVIDIYSHGKPTLVFCSSRKSCQQTAEILVKNCWGRSSFVLPQSHQEIKTMASRIQEKKLSELLMKGVGIHHAGLEVQDRRLVEELFRAGKLAVLVATSTLSVGVNLPAHLVVVKATHIYVMGVACEYSDQQVLQMIGRAGRPQFDTSATVVIMTKAQLKAKYEALVNGTQVIESMLHKNLTEHVNVEVVLNTITDMADAASWLSHTLLHVRATKNPRHYGLPSGMTTQQVEQKLQDLCMTAINKLNSLHLVSVDPETAMTSPTERGRLMARYCLEFQTVKHLLNMPLKSSVEHLIGVVSTCSEFDDIQLRTSEKKTLNLLNRNKHQETVRYPLQGKIKTKYMKVNCLVQAGLGCLHIQDYSLSQDLMKIFRVGQRITKCLMELQWLGEDYTTLLHAVQLCKAFKARLWPDSKHVARQLEGIGPTISQALVRAGLSSFQLLEAADPHHLELVVNRHPPFGNRVHDAVTHLPRYELVIQQEKHHQATFAELVISVTMLNAEDVKMLATCGEDHQLVFVIGDEDNTIVFKWKLSDRMLLSQMWRRKVLVKRGLAGSILHVGLISLDWVGLDIHTEYQPFYTTSQHLHRELKHAPPSVQADCLVGQKKRGRPDSGSRQQKETGKSSKQGSCAQGQEADKIQQQLAVMHFKLQQFQHTALRPNNRLEHKIEKGMVNSPQTDVCDQNTMLVTSVRRTSVRREDTSSIHSSTVLAHLKRPMYAEDRAPGNTAFSNLPVRPWKDDYLSPEVNLQTEPWGDLVDDFWDESDFDEPPSKTLKTTACPTNKTGVSDITNQVSSGGTGGLTAGTGDTLCAGARRSAEKQPTSPTSCDSTVPRTAQCQDQCPSTALLVTSTASCSRVKTNSAVSTNLVENAAKTLSVQSTSCYPGVIPNTDHTHGSTYGKNTELHEIPSSHILSSAIPRPYLHTDTESLPPGVQVETIVKAPGICSSMDAMDTLTSRVPSPFSSKDKLADFEEPSAKPDIAERWPTGRENVARQSGFGWEHLQLYQSSREAMVNQVTGVHLKDMKPTSGMFGNFLCERYILMAVVLLLRSWDPTPTYTRFSNTQESSKGEDSSLSQMPELHTHQLNEPVAMPTSQSPAQPRLIGITPPMVTGIMQDRPTMTQNRDPSYLQSVTTANLLRGIF